MLGAVLLLQVDIADMERRLFRPLYVESWFMADIKLGALALNLEPPKCFAAEAYACEWQQGVRMFALRAFSCVPGGGGGGSCVFVARYTHAV